MYKEKCLVTHENLYVVNNAVMLNKYLKQYRKADQETKLKLISELKFEFKETFKEHSDVIEKWDENKWKAVIRVTLV